jgi:D-lactate dehydrogenase
MFAEFPSETLSELFTSIDDRTFIAGSVISQEGSLDPYCYFVITGRIRIIKKLLDGSDGTIRFALPGELLGLTSLFIPNGRSATMIADVDTSILMIPHEKLKSFIRGEKGNAGEIVTGALFRELARRVRQKNARLAALPGTDIGKKVSVAVFDAKPYIEDIFLKLAPEQLSLSFLPFRLSRETARFADGYSIIVIFVNDKIDAETAAILKESGVQLIALRCAGFNNIDLKTCTESGMAVTRVPAYSPHAVAEHSLALLMTLNRKIHKAYERVRNGDFRLDGLVGVDLFGKTVGVIGTGKIGECFINIMRGLGCHIVAYDPNPNPALKLFPDVRYTSLHELFSISDVISLHAPLTRGTHHLIDTKAFAMMKSGAILINTSRGALVDTQALIDALKERKLAGAALDVYEEEEAIFFEDFSSDIITDDILSRLMAFNNVIVTGHQAFLTKEALSNIALTTFSNIREFLEGKRCGELTNEVRL